MNEQPYEPEKKEDSDSVHFTRHSKADYLNYRQIKSSDNPRRGIDPENQIVPDVPEAGIALAEEKAEELLSKFDPENDILFFASSNEARAI